MMKILLIKLLLIISTISIANAEIKYFCNGKDNDFFINLNTQNKTIVLGNNKPKKYWTKANYIFWQSANDYTLHEYTFKNSYNKLTGVLKVKSHHLVTSEDRWYDYECIMNQ